MPCSGPATTLYYKSVLKGKVIDASPIMDWQRSQATIFRDKNGNMHFVKASGKSSSGRIDGIDQSLFGLKVLADNLPTAGTLVRILTKEEIESFGWHKTNLHSDVCLSHPLNPALTVEGLPG
jgi:hypothetical protein